MDHSGFFSGCVGGGAGTLVGHPLDTVKVRIQTHAGEGSDRGIWICLRNIVSSEGLAGLYKGLLSPLIGFSAQNALLFGVHHTTKNYLGNNMKDEFLSGCLSGAILVGLTTPIEFIKIQLQLQAVGQRTFTNEKSFRGPLQVVKHFYKKYGFVGCFRGGSITFVRDTPSYGVHFFAYAYFCKLFARLRQTTTDLIQPLDLFIAGGFAGMTSWGMCYPIDVVKSRIQADGFLPHGKYRSSLHCTKIIYEQEGARAFIKGVNTTLIRAFPVNAATFATFTLTKRIVDDVAS